MVCALKSTINEIRISNNANIIMRIGKISSKIKLFQSLLITLNLFIKVALKWIQNLLHNPDSCGISSKFISYKISYDLFD